MAAALTIGFLLAAAVVLRAACAVMLKGVTWRARVFFLTCCAAALIGAYFTTFHSIDYVNPDTRIFGWPIPLRVHQRANATSPWLDFAGPTVILAYPMNVILFALLPAIISLVWVRRLTTRAREPGA